MSAHNMFKIEVKLFIAGVRMPVQSVTISNSFNSIPTATISMPPDSRLYGIGRRDRVPVQIFVKDTFSGVTTDALNNKQSATFGKDILMYEGEISSFAYNSTSINREFVINAQGLMSFMRDVNLKIMQEVQDYAAATVPGEQYKVMETTGTLKALLPSHLFSHGLFTDNSDTLDSSNGIKFPYEFLANSVKYLTGSGRVNIDTEVWKFFKKYTNMLKLNNRIVPVPCFDDGQYMPDGAKEVGFPILRALQSMVTLNTLSKAGMDAMRSGTLYDFINIVTKNMEYEFAFPSTPTPVGTPGSKDFIIPSMYLKPIMYEALPPKCNVIYASMSDSLRTTESVYKVPTRIQTADVHGVLASLASGSNDYTLATHGYTEFWPRGGAVNTGTVPDNKEPQAQNLLASEVNTGPHMYSTEAPRWLSMLSPTGDKEKARKFNDDVRKHMLLLKIYEMRDMSINIPFNPFLTVGYPIVIYDSEDTGFTFIGHLLTVEHYLSEDNVSTTASIGFVRLIDDELHTEEGDEELASTSTTLHNTFKDISDNVTKQYIPMQLIYNKILGCDPIPSFIGVKYGDMAVSKAHKDPAVAYKETYRRIATLEDYNSLMGLTTEYNHDGKISGLRDNGTGFLSNRQDLANSGKLVETLRSISADISENETYATSFSLG